MSRGTLESKREGGATLRILAISGSARAGSTNTALLRELAAKAPAGIRMELFESVAELPVFSSDLEGARTPAVVEAFCARVRRADGLLLSSPEYVRAIPGGLKNAIDWLVSRAEIMHEPIAIVHASHRGDDMLESLRKVLGTVTSRFDEASFVRFPMMGADETRIRELLEEPEHAERLRAFWASYERFMGDGSRGADGRGSGTS